jgi:hypothetical protein
MHGVTVWRDISLERNAKDGPPAVFRFSARSDLAAEGAEESDDDLTLHVIPSV